MRCPLRYAQRGLLVHKPNFFVIYRAAEGRWPGKERGQEYHVYSGATAGLHLDRRGLYDH